MNLINKMQTWKSDLEELATEKAKAEGRLEQALEALKAAGFNSVEEAVVELEKRKKAKADAEADAEELLAGFAVKYSAFIE